MFNEIDTDGSKNISISELQNLFKSKYDINVKEIIDKMRHNSAGYFDNITFKELRTLDNKEQNIEDDFSLEQLAGIFFFDFVIIDYKQEEIIEKKCLESAKKREKFQLETQLKNLAEKGIK
jgi:hypothetical protein